MQFITYLHKSSLETLFLLEFQYEHKIVENLRVYCESFAFEFRCFSIRVRAAHLEVTTVMTQDGIWDDFL